jgi:iron(III) transport system substrate-binding protein
MGLYSRTPIHYHRVRLSRAREADMIRGLLGGWVIRLCLWPAARLAILLLLLLLPRAEACAQTPDANAIFTYSGPDRTQRLIEGAKKEGRVTLYSSAALPDVNALIGPFEKKYGIKVQIWRGSSEDIRYRAMTEYRGGRYDVDVAETAGSDMEPLVREQLLREIRTPASAELIPQATFPHHRWIATRLVVFTGAYNTSIMAAAAMPKSYEDLLAPRWKAKLGIESEDARWFMSVVDAVGEQKGLRLFKDIVAANGISMRKGHTLLANLVATGEVPLALTTYSYKVDQLKGEGAPIEAIYLPPVIALPTGAGVFQRAPHPFAAMLLVDFYLTEGQRILADREGVPTNPNVKQPPSGLILVDLARYIDEGEKWTRLFNETFVNRGR